MSAQACETMRCAIDEPNAALAGTVVAVGVDSARSTGDTAVVGAGLTSTGAGRARRRRTVNLEARARGRVTGRNESVVEALVGVCRRHGADESARSTGTAKTRKQVTRRESAVAVDERAGEASVVLSDCHRRKRDNREEGDSGAHDGDFEDR